MATHQEFYREQADKMRCDAQATTLDNVRERCLRSAEAWDEMASRVERTDRMRAEQEARKAAAQA